MDIRKYFSAKNTSTTGQNKKEDTKASMHDSKKEAKSSKKRRIIESDSDDDPVPTEIRKVRSPKKVDQKTKAVTKASPDKRKEVSVSDFFGSVPVARMHKEASPKTKRLKESVHEDKDFEATLFQLDKKTQVNGKKSKDAVKPSQDGGNKNEKSSKTFKTKDNDHLKADIELKPVKKIIEVDLPDEKPKAKKPRNSGAANYTSYLHREGPKALGSKEIPKGEEQCLNGLTFIITGVLESLEREEAKSLVEKYGGKVMSTLSKNTKYIIIGRDAGASKLDKAEKLGTKQLDEDGLLDLIRTMPGKKETSKKFEKDLKKPEMSSQKASLSESLKIEDSMDMDDSIFDAVEETTIDKTMIVKTEEYKKEVLDVQKETTTKEESSLSNKHSKITEDPQKHPAVEMSTLKAKSPQKLDSSPEKLLLTSMWVDRYKPVSLKQLIGQQGEKSNAKKLLIWVKSWARNRTLNKKAIPGRFNANDDGSGFKAALLSGSPGVGKTTTAQLVCKEAGFEYCELNASDTRSKKNLQQSVSQLLGNQTLADCFKDSGKVSRDHVIIMDEVDGMAGNEDRGGMQELISFIKLSKVPIICICNDRNHQKIRSLANYCFDLRFQKPRVEQIKAAMMSIAFKEHIKVSSDVLQDIIVAANQDIRQVLHNMSMWSAHSKGLSSEQAKSDIGKGTKHIKMGPFDVLREVFAIGSNPKATIADKSDLFFHDYSIAPLFVQENYVHVTPTAAAGDKHKHLTLLSEAADSICIGDMIDRQIRSQQSWGLLPTQAIFASVIPGQLLSGHMRQMINFPSWLGKNSTRSHMDRVLQELHVHMRMKITGNKTDISLEYLPLLKRALTKPLVNEEQNGIPEVLQIMENYYLLREDFDSVIDLSLWPGQTDPRTKIITKVKSAFTRAYNKESGKNPYAITNIKKKKKFAAEEIPDDEEVVNVSEEEEDDNIENDAMIKVKKPSKKSTCEPSTSRAVKEKKKNSSRKNK